MKQPTYVELFGKRVEGWPATVLILAIWVLPFFAGYLAGVFHHQ
jgi:hypothetical protein